MHHTSARPGKVRRPFLAIGAAVGLMATACAPSADPVSDAEQSPTFDRIVDESFLYTDDLATPFDLIAPTGSDPLWRIVGSVLDPANGRTQAAVWESDNGRVWERSDLPPTERGVSEQVRSVTRVGDDLLAVGSSGLGEDADAAVWRSAGGEDASWEQVLPPEMAGRHELWGFDVAAGPGGVVVAGGERTWGDVRPRMWHSPDGESWQAVEDGEDGPFSESGQESISAVTQAGDGFVAVGWERVDGEQRGLAWHSPDGVSWEAVEAPELDGEGRQAALSVAYVDGTVVAGGYTAEDGGRGRPVVWRSEDGQDWSGPSEALSLADTNRSSAEDLAVRSLQVIEPSLPDPDGEGEGEGESEGDDSEPTSLVASGGARARPNMWTSSDGGSSWDRLPAPRQNSFPDGIDLVTAARAGSDTVAIGDEPLVVRLDDERWLPSSSDTFPDGGAKPVAMSVVLDDEEDVTLVGGYELENWLDGTPRQHYEAHVWQREGDGDFATVGPADPEENPFQQFDTGAIEAMSSYGRGYVAVGVENFSVASERYTSVDPSPDGLLWISPDGREWTRYGWQAGSFDAEETAEIYTSALDDYSPEEIATAVALVTADQPRSTQAPAGGAGTRSLRGVAPMGDSGFITVGSAFTDGSSDGVVAVATGDDGIEGEDAGLSGGDGERFNDVCRAPGVLIAVGSTGAGGGLSPAIHYRDSGWHEATSSDDSFTASGNQQALACAVSDEGFIAVGVDDTSGDRNARAWVSDDGMEWRELTSGLFGGPGDQEANAVAPVPGGGWLVAGTDTAGTDAGVALWRIQEDGTVTRRDMGEPTLASSLPMSVSDIAISDSRTVVVGTDVDGLGVWETDTEDLDR